MEGIRETLEKIGEKNSTDLGKWLRKCSICKKEYKFTDIEFAEHCPKCVNRRKATIEIMRNIPRKYLSINTDKTRLLQDNLNCSLFVTGPAGTGKTVFSCSFLKEQFYLGRQGKFISYPSFIMELQNTFRFDDLSPFDYAKKIALFEGVLVMDDLGAEKLTDFVRQTTYYILNEREQRCLQTAITSNFSLAQIDEQIDSRVSSRIAGMCKVFKFEGKDRRISK
jgi:DNA replication protein DnaC